MKVIINGRSSKEAIKNLARVLEEIVDKELLKIELKKESGNEQV